MKSGLRSRDASPSRGAFRVSRCVARRGNDRLARATGVVAHCMTSTNAIAEPPSDGHDEEHGNQDDPNEFRHDHTLDLRLHDQSGVHRKFISSMTLCEGLAWPSAVQGSGREQSQGLTDRKPVLLRAVNLAQKTVEVVQLFSV